MYKILDDDDDDDNDGLINDLRLHAYIHYPFFIIIIIIMFHYCALFIVLLFPYVIACYRK